MKDIDSKMIDQSIQHLLSYAMSSNAVMQEYDKYIYLSNRKLYTLFSENMAIGCIGIEIFETSNCIIKHLAVLPTQREMNAATKMIDFITEKHSLTQISAETDGEAVGFYEKYGFEITSLGEKYPGVERFQCIYKTISYS